MAHLAITGLGLVTTVGHDVVTAYGALRCGMARPWPVDFEVPADDGNANTSLTAHPLRGITDGFQGMGRYLRMATHAVEDLLHDASLHQEGAGFWQGTALYVGLSRTRNAEIDFYDELLEENLPGELASRTRLPFMENRRHVLFRGHAAALWALHEASAAIESGQTERAIIVGVDSLLESDTLQVLAASRRLKTNLTPRGLMPGEGAAAFLVEPVARARARKAPIQCVVERIALSQERESRVSGARSAGVALSEVIEKVLPPGRPLTSIYGDLNGEDARAEEWANALVRLSASRALSTAAQYWLAASLGDTGAASGALSVVIGARALFRGHASGGDVLIWSSADTGEVAAALLRRTEPPVSSPSRPGARR
jgi:3-oxoacyl-[acyl-carrier-protein] synthase-1